jgi:hypothetical protein
MKRLWNVAAFALLACAGLATPTQAGSFGLFYCGRHGSECAVCIRPYNAFTPVLCGDVGGYGGCGQGGCGQGGYGPIGCPCGYGCGQGGCGQGGCGYGGCGAGGYAQGGYGYGWGQQNGWDPRLRMMNLGGNGDPAYTGALGYNPPDGYGNGAFGTYGLGRLSVFGLPVDGGCASCRPNYPVMNTFNPAPMACGPTGCAPSYGFGMDFGTPSFATPGTPAESKPALLQIPTKFETKEIPQARSNYGYPTQPVSYMPTYPNAGQQMPYYGYTQPAWGYYGYQTPYYQGW